MNTDFRVVHLDLIYDGAEPGAAEGRVAGEDVLAHDGNEPGDLGFGDLRFRRHFRDSPIKDHLRRIAFLANGRNPVFQGRIVRVGNAVLDGLIEAAEPSFRIGELGPQRRQAAGKVGIPFGLPLH